MEPIWTIAGVTRYIREMFEIDYALQDVMVEGEVSNLTQARSGHLYFTLKDADAQLKCVMWKSSLQRQAYLPAHGDAVRAHGRISVYEAGGAYQLYADWLEPAGRGDLHRQFELLKAKLEAEGLFDDARKKPLPRFPHQIGVVTSADAAALRDILNVLGRRWPLANVLLAPTLVQGAEAPSQIVHALAVLDQRDDVDLIIVARGGGSLEDLWAFNDERVARAIAGCRHPVISGVGHETDFTIADFVADRRAPTPSAAAELATPDLEMLTAGLLGLKEQLIDQLMTRISSARWQLDATGRTLRALSPRRQVLNRIQGVDELAFRLDKGMQHHLQRSRQHLAGLARTLAAVSPLATLSRGYAIVRRDDDGSIVSHPTQVTAGDRLAVRVKGGEFQANVTD